MAEALGLPRNASKVQRETCAVEAWGDYLRTWLDGRPKAEMGAILDAAALALAVIRPEVGRT